MLEQIITAFIISRGGSINCSHVGELMAAINTAPPVDASAPVEDSAAVEPKPRAKKLPRL
jgi:hypothetical protein